MQPKVSMIVSCYNKVNYISGMLDSVLSQKWDNIEIILVNDGSNDGTRDVIAQYEDKLIARGYEVIIWDQENQGVAAAVRNGLKLVTGEFVCMPDCDDLLHEEYVSAMVNALRQSPHINCVVCDVVKNRWDMGFSPKLDIPEINVVSNYNRNLLKKYILGKFLTNVALIVFRASIITELQLIETFITNQSNTQEPQIWLPILASEDFVLHLRRPLYSYILREDSIVTSQTSMETIDKYAESRCVLSQNTLKHCVEPSELDFFCKIEAIYKDAFLVRRINRNPHLESYKDFYINQFVQTVKASGLLPCLLNEKRIEEAGYSTLFYAVSNYLTQYSPPKKDTLTIIRRTQSRLIAYGAGFVAKSTLEDFIKCNIVPDEVWDIKAQGYDQILDIPLVIPDFGSLTREDTVIILMYGNLDVERELRKTECNVFYFQDVLNDLGAEYFPELIVNINNKEV